MEQEVKQTTKEENSNTSTVDPKDAELEELRAFKSQVEAERKATVELEAQKKRAEEKETVSVSNTFFSKNEEVAQQKQKSNTEKFWEKQMGIGVPKRYEE